ncbi:MAG: alpha/beta fold hydrolase [Polyangiaceae bacterium]|nr:alpha/beta fold hydrolase [Myxococcales bacterium]MCB9587846.1 alpha/beta fold hydrolase [Polyangiaceae bacterium]MCB9608795.1 alpha/beta fold hydrolase [Polyangiaceae bacterium]
MDIVFLHGFTGTPGSFRWVAEALAPTQARVFAPILVGHAGGPSAASSFEQEVERLSREIDEAGFRGAHLIGYSLGSRVSLGLLMHDQTQFASATLVGVHPGLESEAARKQRVQADEGWCELLERQGITAFIRAWMTLPLWETQKTLDEAKLEAQSRDRMTHTALGLACALRSLGLGQMPAYVERLHTLKLPVHLVVGEQDAKFLEIATRIVRQLPQGDLQVAPSSGHNVLLERPDFIAQVLRSADTACPPPN